MGWNFFWRAMIHYHLSTDFLLFNLFFSPRRHSGSSFFFPQSPVWLRLSRLLVMGNGLRELRLWVRFLCFWTKCLQMLHFSCLRSQGLPTPTSLSLILWSRNSDIPQSPIRLDFNFLFDKADYLREGLKRRGSKSLLSARIRRSSLTLRNLLEI